MSRGRFIPRRNNACLVFFEFVACYDMKAMTIADQSAAHGLGGSQLRNLSSPSP